MDRQTDKQTKLIIESVPCYGIAIINEQITYSYASTLFTSENDHMMYQ